MGKIVELRLAVLDESGLVAKAGMVAVLSKMKIESVVVVVVVSRVGRPVRRRSCWEGHDVGCCGWGAEQEPLMIVLNCRP